MVTFSQEVIEADNVMIYGVIETALIGLGLTIDKVVRSSKPLETTATDVVGYMDFMVDVSFDSPPELSNINDVVIAAVLDNDGPASTVKFYNTTDTTTTINIKSY
jgi:hypothetical protein